MFNIHFHPFVCCLVVLFVGFGRLFRVHPKWRFLAKQLTKNRTNKCPKKCSFLALLAKSIFVCFQGNVTLGLVTQVDVLTFSSICWVVGLLGFVLLGLGDRLGFTQSGFWVYTYWPRTGQINDQKSVVSFFLSFFLLLACPSLFRYPWTGDPSGCFTFIRIHFHLFRWVLCYVLCGRVGFWEIY